MKQAVGGLAPVMVDRSHLQPVARVEDIPAGGMVFTFREGGLQESGILVRTDGVTRAWRNLCRHLSVPLDHCERGRVHATDGWHLQCTEHGATYRPDTGECVAGPCKGSRLRPLPVEEHDGTVFLDPRRLGGLLVDRKPDA
jgi:nitrite reductase/ring-hydroxylating ferredoxin subunit